MEYLGFSNVKPLIFSLNSFELTAWSAVMETIFLIKGFDFIYLEIKKMARLNYKVDFGATKWQYENFDCVDFYIELLILLNCQYIDRCRPCRHFFRWIIEILHDKWDNIRFIDLDEALKMTNFLKKSVSKSVPLEHFTSNCRLLKQIIRTVKKKIKKEKQPKT